MPYFEKGLHLWVEKMDSDNNMDAINAWLIKDSANERFLHYWIEKTTPITRHVCPVSYPPLYYPKPCHL